MPVDPSVLFGLDIDLNDNDIRNVSTVDLAIATLMSQTTEITVTTPVLFDAFDASEYRSAEYLFQMSQVSSYAQVRVLVIHNGTDVAITEYAQVSIGPDIPYVIDGAYAQDDLELTITCSTANFNPITLKFSRVLFDV